MGPDVDPDHGTASPAREELGAQAETPGQTRGRGGTQTRTQCCQSVTGAEATLPLLSGTGSRGPGAREPPRSLCVHF